MATGEKLENSEVMENSQIVAGFLVSGLEIHSPSRFEEMHQTCFPWVYSGTLVVVQLGGLLGSLAVLQAELVSPILLFLYICSHRTCGPNVRLEIIIGDKLTMHYTECSSELCNPRGELQVGNYQQLQSFWQESNFSLMSDEVYQQCLKLVEKQRVSRA
jgi:hypothetical protein